MLFQFPFAEATPFRMKKALILFFSLKSQESTQLVKTLEESGYRISLINDRKIALERVKTISHDLILLDLILTEQKKLRITDFLTGNSQLTKTPIICLSSSKFKEDLLAAFEQGAVDYLVKPVFLPELLIKIQTHLERKQIIDELQKANSQLERLVRTDLLTGILSRRAIIKVGEQEFERGRRYRLPLSLLIIDVDYFKQINDIYGHDVGDEVLQKIAKILSKCLRRSDRLGRWGGEEFVVLLPHTPPDASIRVASRIREAVAQLDVLTSGGQQKVTVSIGVADYKEDDVSWKELFKRADQALYWAKNHGRNRVAAFDDLPD